MTPYYAEPRTRKFVKECEFLLLTRNLSNKYGKKLRYTGAKAGLDIIKNASKSNS